MAMQDWQEGRGQDALDAFQASADVADAAGDEFTSSATRGNIGDVLVKLGRADEAEPVLREVVATQRALAATAFEATARRSLAVALALQGRWGEAESVLADVREQQERLTEDDELTETIGAQALVALLSGDAERGLVLAEEAEARARTADAVYLLVPILRVKGAALIDLDRAEEARTWLNEALEGCPEAEFERGFILAELARAAGPGDAAGLQAQAEAAWTDFGWVGSARYPRADPR